MGCKVVRGPSSSSRYLIIVDFEDGQRCADRPLPFGIAASTQHDGMRQRRQLRNIMAIVMQNPSLCTVGGWIEGLVHAAAVAQLRGEPIGKG